jgi:hypothetical protein
MQASSFGEHTNGGGVRPKLKATAETLPCFSFRWAADEPAQLFSPQLLKELPRGEQKSRHR